MRSPKKGRPPQMALADLKPAEQIICLCCDQTKPAEGSRPFHAHRVCAECATKVQAK